MNYDDKISFSNPQHLNSVTFQECVWYMQTAKSETVFQVSVAISRFDNIGSIQTGDTVIYAGSGNNIELEETRLFSFNIMDMEDQTVWIYGPEAWILTSCIRYCYITRLIYNITITLEPAGKLNKLY